MSRVEVKQPFISINKLAEYAIADALRRREIVSQMKKDKDFYKVYYQPVRAAIGGYFKGGYDNNLIDSVLSRLQSDLANPLGLSEWDVRDKKISIDALKSIKECRLPLLSDYEIVSDISKIENIELSGVVISVKPELYLRHKTTGRIGGLKVHMAKTEKHRLNGVAMSYAATVVKYSFLQNGFNEKDVDNDACISLGIFEQMHASAPNAYKRTINSLAANCEEIALRWSEI